MSTPWRAPKRPDHKVSQTFTDGLVTIFRTRDVSQPGYAPEKRTEELLRLPYANRRLGLQRYFAAKEAQEEAERVIRVPRTGKVSSLDTAQTEDGQKYRISLVQLVPEIYPPCDDVTLVHYETGAST